MRVAIILAALLAIAFAVELMPMRAPTNKGLSLRQVDACSNDPCQSSETCCTTPQGPGCCPSANACCCPDQQHCCQSGYKCVCSGNTCTGCTQSGGSCASMIGF